MMKAQINNYRTKLLHIEEEASNIVVDMMVEKAVIPVFETTLGLASGGIVLDKPFNVASGKRSTGTKKDLFYQTVKATGTMPQMIHKELHLVLQQLSWMLKILATGGFKHLLILSKLFVRLEKLHIKLEKLYPSSQTSLLNGECLVYGYLYAMIGSWRKLLQMKWNGSKTLGVNTALISNLLFW